MQDAKQQLADKLKTANNVLVTVSRNPSVDQLSALLGLTLILNKQGKHAAAVYSGQTPSTIEFLQPEETIEKTTDSLRDFIIALDKNKADKLRYKVEDDVVRIFITPYKTSISKDDFEFSQGDFNVDVVVALGVGQQEDLDDAITSHGRILHDATVASISLTSDGGLGSISWHAPEASSLSELVTELAGELGPNPFDEQIATALLTGIVAETDRFSNDKTSSTTMSASAQLMQAGANQQLIASKLQEGAPAPVSTTATDDGGVKVTSESAKKDDGAMEIDHQAADMPAMDLPTPDDSAAPEPAKIDEPKPMDANPNLSTGSRMITEPPTLGGTLTANSSQSDYDMPTDPLSMPASEPPQLLKRDPAPLPPEPPTAPTPPEPPKPAEPTPPAPPAPTPAPPSWVPPAPAPLDITPDPDKPAAGQTLHQLEESVHSPHLDPAQLDSARSQVDAALNGAEAAGTAPPSPIQALNAQPMGGDLHPSTPAVDELPSGAPMPPPSASADDPSAPPPVPPPIPFQFGNTPPPQ